MPSIKQLKQDYINYYEDTPVQKYAAMSVCRDEDTILRWRKEDQKFADAVQRAKANWVRNRMLETKAEFALERLEKDIFSAHSTVEVEQKEKKVGAYLPNMDRMEFFTKCEEFWHSRRDNSDIQTLIKAAHEAAKLITSS